MIRTSLIALASGFLFAALIGVVHAAPSIYPAAPPSAGEHCDAPNDIIAWFKNDTVTSGDEVYLYEFTGDDAAKLAAALVQLAGPSADPVAVEWVAFDLTSAEAIVFEYTPAGCATDFLDAFSNDEIATLLLSLGIAPPVGPTYHQLPGVPSTLGGRGGIRA